MQYSAPERLSDGRYFVKASPESPHYVTLNNVSLGEVSGETVITGDLSRIKAIDESVITDAVTNSVSWFSKEIPRELISNYYQSSIEDTTLQVVPSTNAKGRVNVAFFGENREPLTEVPQPGTICNLLVQFEGLWFLKRSFGPVWKLIQGRVKKQMKPAQCMIADSDSD